MDTEKKVSNSAILKLVKQNKKSIAENNKLLKKIYRNIIWGFWIRIIWIAVIIGLPFLLYFYVIEPHLIAMGFSYERFIDIINELPGFEGIEQFINNKFTN